MTEGASQDTVTRVDDALANGTAIEYGSSFPDKEYPEIVWSRFGLRLTNEIAVIASVGRLRLGIAQRSNLETPAMGDRVYGIDVEDQRLSLFLSAELWAADSDTLVAEALRFRSAH